MEPIYEHILGKELGLGKDVLKKMRRELLSEGTDWRHAPGKGILVLESGQKKMRAAAAVPGLPARAPGPDDGNPKRRPVIDPGVDLVVTRTFPLNLRIVECRLEPDDGQRVNVRVRASDEMGLRAGSVLPGCTSRPGTAVWNFTGRARL